MTNSDVLFHALREFIAADEIEPLDADDAFGITPKGWHYTGWTVYVQGNSFALYDAIPDLRHNVDIADEKLILTGTQFAVQNYLRTAMKRPIERAAMIHSSADGVQLRKTNMWS